MTINTLLSVCLVLLQWVRLISLLPGLEEMSGLDNQKNGKKKAWLTVIYGPHSVSVHLRDYSEHCWSFWHCCCRHYPSHDFFKVFVFPTDESRFFSLFGLQSRFSGLNFPREGFIVSLGILTATCVLSGFTLIAFGWGVLLNTHRPEHTNRLREVSLVKSEALLFHYRSHRASKPSV